MPYHASAGSVSASIRRISTMPCRAPTSIWTWVPTRSRGSRRPTTNAPVIDRSASVTTSADCSRRNHFLGRIGRQPNRAPSTATLDPMRRLYERAGLDTRLRFPNAAQANVRTGECPGIDLWVHGAVLPAMKEYDAGSRGDVGSPLRGRATTILDNARRRSSGPSATGKPRGGSCVAEDAEVGAPLSRPCRACGASRRVRPLFDAGVGARILRVAMGRGDCATHQEREPP